MREAKTLKCGRLPDSSPSSQNVRVALVGDVVGKPGLRIAESAVRWLRKIVKAEGLIVNAENTADGSGLRCKEFKRLMAAGYDFVTLGDHIYRKREIYSVLKEDNRLIKPCNLPANSPGKGSASFKTSAGTKIGVVSALGRTFMKPVDCPFRAVEQELDNLKDIPVRILDFHAEATSDKQVMGRFLDGRVSAVIGTHTHVTTADAGILPNGTALHSDVGMTGPYESIIGRKIEPVLEATIDSSPATFDVATLDVRLAATWVDIDRSTGKAVDIGFVQVAEETIEDFA